MPRIFISLLLISLISLWCQPAPAGALPAQTTETPCQWPQAAHILQQGPQELHQLWQFSDHPMLWSETLPQSASLQAFQQDVRALIPELDPGRRYRTHPPARDGEAYNKLLASSGRAGELRPISCLEALLLSEQTARLPMLKQPSEFGAFILRRNPAGTHEYRIYFSTQDQPGLRMNPRVMALIEADRQAGWTVWAHLHNHNFFPGQADPFASPSPGKTDVEFARMLHKSLQLENIWVTNGFHTLHLSQREFYVFQGHSD